MPQFKIAIVGAGPAGYFTAQALQNSQTEDLTFQVDMIERLPTPWGLVRSGVAPDHPKIKTVAKVFEKVAAELNFNLYANVELGTDITIEELKDRYDAVVMCTGSQIGKKLGIPGEDLSNSISAADFVPWYNGHPDYENFQVDLSGKVAAVIGAGNVSMDCARMLAIEASELDETDTADYALAKLHSSEIKKVYVLARRGAEFAAFTAPELRELPKLEHTDVYINPDAIDLAQTRAERAGEVEKHVASNLEAMRLVAESQKSGNEKSMEFLFEHVPLEITGREKVEGIIVKTPDGEKTIPCDLVITAIGYESLPIAGIPFEKGRIKNEDGRVVATNIYTVGWAKRGPSGVIGTNKSDAADVVKLLIEDLKTPKSTSDIRELLKPDHEIVDQAFWTRINAAEVKAGEAHGKPRVKATSIAKLMSLGRG
jgi:ferredoxin/flavodoxin---NADP+ reductase